MYLGTDGNWYSERVLKEHSKDCIRIINKINDCFKETHTAFMQCVVMDENTALCFASKKAFSFIRKNGCAAVALQE